MCYSPIELKTAEGVQRVGCRHCRRCAMRRTMSWTLRLLMESEGNTCTDFITLTYREEACPERLSSVDINRFIRRLRKSTRGSVRYFYCGEYGGKTKRPHWHVLLFGHRLPQRGLQTFDLWPHGHVHAGELERKSAAYVCRYTLKSQGLTQYPQLVQMSRRPGIGFRKLQSFATELAKQVPEMDHFPSVINWSSKRYWLDQRAYEVVRDAYEAAGGWLRSDVAVYNHRLETADGRALDADIQAFAKDHAYGSI